MMARQTSKTQVQYSHNGVVSSVVADKLSGLVLCVVSDLVSGVVRGLVFVQISGVVPSVAAGMIQFLLLIKIFPISRKFCWT